MRRGPQVRQLGRYEMLLELSRGGMGELYLARRVGAGGFAKLVAIKRILPHLASEPAFVELFQHEAKIAARLSHPNVCTVFELDAEDGELFLVMEYLEGVAWDVLAAATPADEILPLAASVLAQACEGLHHAHAVPVIHRDVSPQNLFVTTAGACKVLDFGVAKLANEGPRTRTGMLKGKLPYMAPEQIEGGEVDPRADVWSLGVVLWEALARRSLFDRATDFQIWKAVTEEPVPALADQPAAVNAVIARATARARDDRFATARELGEALRAVVPPLDALAIADLVARRCGDRIAERAAAIAAASEPVAEDPGASATLVDAAETARLRSKPIVVERPRSAAATAPMGAASDGEMEAPEKVRRSRWPFAVAAIAIAAIVGIAVIATRPPGSGSASESGSASATGPASASGSGAEPGSASASESGSASGSASASASGPASASASESASGSASASASASASGSASGPASGPASGLTGTAGRSRSPSVAAGPAAKPAPAGKGSATPAARGTLTLDSDPYATVFVDGVRTGDTPLFHAQLAAGPHHLHLVLGDGRTQDRDVTVAADRDLNLGRIAW